MNRIKTYFDLDTMLHCLGGGFGYVCAHFQTISGNIIAILTIAILVRRLLRPRSGLSRKEYEDED